MSTDFTGHNKKISNDDLYLMLSEKMANVLGISRQEMYKIYANEGCCSSGRSWGYYDRYTKDFNNNDYVGNDFDNIHILAKAVDKEEFENKELSSAQERRDILNAECSSLIRNSLCNDFTVSGMFPHLDCPSHIVNIQGVSGVIPCIEPDHNYETMYAVISYSDSCGCNSITPVPYYPLNWNEDLSGSIIQKSTLDDSKWGISAEYLWEITKNATEVAISQSTASMTESHIDLATLSSAVDPDIQISLTYTEKN